MERREIIDLASGIAGGLLLVTAMVLFAVVPQDEPIPPTFQVKYVSSSETVPLDQVIAFQERSNTERATISIDSPYIYHIAFDVEWTDDVAASDPDRFDFKIFEPGGEQVTQETVRVENEPPIADVDNDTNTPTGTYSAQLMQYTMDKSLGAPPRDGPVLGEHLEETADEAKARLLEELVTYEPGEWKLEIYLGEAGDCPAVSADPNADNARATACTNETQGEEDTTNNIRVTSVTYTTYDIVIEEPN